MTYAEFQQQLQVLPPEERLLALLAWLNRQLKMMRKDQSDEKPR